MLYQAPVCQLKITCVPSHLFMSDSFDPVDCKLPGSSVYGNSPGKNTEVVCYSLLQWTTFSQYVNCELPDVQAGFRKGKGIRNQIANIHWIIEKARVPEKHLLLLYWLCQSLWLCGSQQTVENYERDGNTRPPWLPPEKTICRSRRNSENWTWNSRLVQNQERNTSRLYIVTLFI